MRHNDLPAKEDNPNDVEEQTQEAIGIAQLDHLFAKGRKGRKAQLDRLQPKGNADDGHTEQQPTDDVAYPSDQPAKNQPNNIANQTHSDTSILLRIGYTMTHGHPRRSVLSEQLESILRNLIYAMG